MSDHYANDDNHALYITKNIISNLNNNNNKQNIESNIDEPEPPLYPDEELYGIVGDNLKKNYDVREVFFYLFIGFFLNIYIFINNLGYCKNS